MKTYKRRKDEGEGVLVREGEERKGVMEWGGGRKERGRGNGVWNER